MSEAAMKNFCSGAAAAAEDALVVRELKKRYPHTEEHAVNGISFRVARGEVVGLTGRNGAGKSTTLGCVTGRLARDGGEVYVCGEALVGDGRAAKRRLGFVTDDHAVFDRMTGREYISFIADVFGVGREEREARVAEYSALFKMTGRLDSSVGSYSHGMKQKVCIMGSLVHSPELWILDEPMLGLDAEAADALCELMRRWAAEGRAVLFATHDARAVERVCDRVITLEKGRIVLPSGGERVCGG